MIRAVASLAILGASVVHGCAPTVDTGPAQPPVTVVDQAPIREDDPGWDCTTMGNRICGTAGSKIVTAYGCVTDDGYPFQWRGLMDNLPDECRVAS